MWRDASLFLYAVSLSSVWRWEGRRSAVRGEAKSVKCSRLSRLWSQLSPAEAQQHWQLFHSVSLHFHTFFFSRFHFYKQPSFLIYDEILKYYYYSTLFWFYFRHKAHTRLAHLELLQHSVWEWEKGALSNWLLTVTSCNNHSLSHQRLLSKCSAGCFWLDWPKIIRFSDM